MNKHTLALIFVAVSFLCNAQTDSLVIIEPEGHGTANESAYFNLSLAFDHQPTWDTVAQSPVNGVSGGGAAPYYGSRYGYIDFGAEYEKIRIVSVWTQYRKWSSGDQTGFQRLWWDNEIDTLTDNGVAETRFNFNNTLALPYTDHTEPWYKTSTFSELDPITPPRRYLIVHSDSAITERALEYAFVGFTVEPDSIDPGPLRNVYFNFGNDHSGPIPWNNVGSGPVAGLVIDNLVDENNINTGISIELPTTWGGVNDEGATTGNDSGVVPDNVLKEFYWFGRYGAPEEVYFTIKGLLPGYKYNLDLIGSSVFRASGITDNGHTNYLIGSSNRSLYVESNTTEKAHFQAIEPDSLGQFTVTLSKGVDAKVGYINGLVLGIPEATLSTPTLSEAVWQDSLGIQIEWKDVNTAESGYEIYRRKMNALDTVFNLVGTTMANDSSFLDTLIETHSIYRYKVRAISSNLSSNYSDEIEVRTIPTKYIMVNFGLNHIGPTPWNTTDQPPLENMVFSNLNDEYGSLTGVRVKINSVWGGYSDHGATTGDDSGIVPDDVLREYYWFGNYGAPDETSLLVEGLDPNLSYNLKLIGSSIFNGFPDNGSTVYKIGGDSKSLYVQGNTSEWVEFFDLVPNNDGQIEINLEKAVGSPVGYINALVLEIPEEVIYAPTNFSAKYLSESGVFLDWDESSSAGVNYEVHRKDITTDGPWQVLTTVSNSTLEYNDSTAIKWRTYRYKIRSIAGPEVSAFTPPAELDIIEMKRVLFNFGKNYSGPSPWNNAGIDGYQGALFTNLIAEDTSSTELTIELLTAWGEAVDQGAVTGDDSGIVPDDVLREYYYFGFAQAPEETAIRISGLSAGSKYNFQFIGSSIFSGAGITDNGYTAYSIDDMLTTLDVENNTSMAAELRGIEPDSSDAIVVNMEKAADAEVGYINGIIIEVPVLLQIDTIVNNYDAVLYVDMHGVDTSAVVNDYRLPWATPHIASEHAHTLSQSDTLSYLVYVRKGTYEDFSIPMPGIDMYFEEDAVVWYNTSSQWRSIVNDLRGGAGDYRILGKGRFYTTTVEPGTDRDAVNFRYNSSLIFEAKEVSSIQLWSNFIETVSLDKLKLRSSLLWSSLSTVVLDSCIFPLGYHKNLITPKEGLKIFNNCSFYLPEIADIPNLLEVTDHNGDSLFSMLILPLNYQFDTGSASVAQLANEQYVNYYYNQTGDVFNVISSFEIRPPVNPWQGWTSKSLTPSFILNNPKFYVNRENGFAFRFIWNESDPNSDYSSTGVQINGGQAIKGPGVKNAVFRQDDKLDSLALDVPVNINGVTFDGFISRVIGSDFFPMNFSNLPPTKSKNFVRVETPRVEISDENYFATASYFDKVTSFDYADGIGRSLQSVVIKSSPGNFDIVSPIEYNPATGRQEKSYLPFTDDNTAPGAFMENSISTQELFYTSGPSDISRDSIPYSYTAYENSPRSRAESATGIGSAWHNADKKSTFDYLIHDGSTGADKVVRWEIVSNANKELEKPRQSTSKPYYAAGELTISQVTNEEGIITQQITDSRGLEIATRTKRSSDWVTTYQVYDKLGQLRFIIPPVLAATYNPSDAQVDGLMFQYIYDDRGRLVKESSPDMGWTYYCYDTWDRLVATQDNRHRQTDLWLYSKYDQYNRIIMSGRETDSRGQIALQNDIMADTVRFENTTEDSIGYTINRTWPVSNTDLLSVTYYDNYDYVDNTNWDPDGINYDFVTDGLNIEKTTFSTRGMVTGSKVKVLGSDTWLNTVTYYDKYSRTIQVIAENHLGGYDRVSSEYNFIGELQKTQLTHSRTPSGSDLTYSQEYTYDNRGRTTHIWNQINTDPKVLVANYNYNELGELIEKNLHSTDEGVSYLQSLDYQFNIRGWTESINKPDLSADSTNYEDNADLFGARYHYTTSNTIGGSSILGRYDGMLAALEWKNSNNGESSFNQSVFGYEYDDLNRLTSATYATGTTSPFSGNAGHFDVSIGYEDDNGNIGSLVRKSENVVIDSLSYGYNAFSNQIDSVVDFSDNYAGFKELEIPGGPYTYDSLGGLASDLNKDIVAFEYNHLNLLTKIEFFETGAIKYTYDAVGNRLSKTLENGDGTVIHKIDYVGLVEYRNDSIYQVFTDAGRAYEQQGEFYYEYFIKDHQGSNRVSFGILPERNVYATTIENGSNDLYFDIPSATVLTSTMPNLNHTPGGTKVNHLDGSASKVVGAAIVIPVTSGDIIDIEAWAMYADGGASGTSQSLLPLILSSFSDAATLADLGETISNGISGTINTTSGILDAFGGSGTEPSAYVNYLFFDSNYDWVSGASNFLSVTDQFEDAYGKLSTGELTMPEDGYLYVYVANEEYNGYNVYFDDIQITHESANTSYRVTEVSDYYPFGMRMTTSWSEDGYLSPGLYYQGSFTLYDSLIDHYEFLARNYDPALGRFISVDPAGQFMSGYVGMGNSPVLTIDPDGEIAIAALAAFVVKAALSSAAVSGAMYAVDVARSDGGFANWDGGAFFNAVWKGAVRGAVTAGLGELSMTFGVAKLGHLSGLGGGLSKLAYGAASTSLVSIAGNLSVGDRWDSSFNVGIGPLTLPFRDGQLSFRPLDHLNNFSWGLTFGKGLFEVIQGDMSLKFDVDNMNPYFQRKPMKDRVVLNKNGSLKKVRKTMFDKYYKSGTDGFTTSDGVSFIKESRGANSASSVFHEGVHAVQDWISGNAFNKRLFEKGIFKFYERKNRGGYNAHPWEHGKYGAYPLTKKRFIK